MNLKTFTKTRTCLIVLCLLTSGILSAQKKAILQAKKERIEQNDKVAKVVMNADRATPHVIEFKDDSTNPLKKEVIPQLLQEFLSFETTTQFDSRPTLYLKGDIEVNRFQQFFNGVKVEHGHYNVLVNKGKLTSLIGEFYEIDQVNTTPTISGEAAINLAKNFVGAEKYAWEVIIESWSVLTPPAIAQAKLDALNEYYPESELVLMDDYDTPEVDLDLAYKLNIYATEPISRAYVYVNAHSGKIMLNNPIIKHATASVTTRYSGVRTIQTSQVLIADNEPNPSKDATLVPDLLFNSSTGAPHGIGETHTHVLIDNSRGTRIETYDLNGVGGLPISAPAYGQARSFTDVDNNWTGDFDNEIPGEHVRGGPSGEANNDDIAWDAHWGAGEVYDYWLNVHGRLSYDGNNAPIYSYVHSGLMYDNAFWNGSVMTYGDGDQFKPLTSLDVCGHEIGHAVCSNTSDLVYASESGAMNEGFSDVWGACQEFYNLQSIRNPNAKQIAEYEPFGIGEQINKTQPAGALRRMDNPQRAGDPDTYGGNNWQNPDCTPTLANDQCGVHSNSGVLNKWFYLLTVGSTTGSGPDAIYAGAGANADNGSNDLGDSYNINGLGFLISEQIAFGTEVMLTPNATFEEARNASILYVTNAYGPCSDEMISTVDAWFAVGVGEEWISCNQPVGFINASALVTEGSTDNTCAAFSTVTPSIFFPGTGSATVAVSGTATEGIDFEVPNTTVASSNGLVSIPVNIFDDAIIEGDETIILTISGLTNATHTITLRDNDIAPRLVDGTVTILEQNFDNYVLPNTIVDTEWAVLKYQIAEPQDLNWYFNAQFGAYIALVEGTPNYATADANSESILRSPLVDGRGLKNIVVEADIIYQGENDGSGIFDYASLVYSFDGVNFTEYPGTQYASTAPTTETISIPLNTSFNGKQFYLGFKWFNDALLSTAYSFSVNDVLISGAATEVASTLNSSIEENLSPNSTAYFYSATNGELMAKIENLSSHDYGCTTVTVDRAGTAAQEYLDAGIEFHLADKTFRVIPTTNNAAGEYNITLYYTATEVTGWQTATGGTWDIDAVVHKSEGSINEVTDGDMPVYDLVAAAALDDQFQITGHFTTGFSGFGAGAIQASALPVELIHFTGRAANSNAVLDWKTATELNNKGFNVQRRTDEDREFTTIDWVDGAGTTTSPQVYQLIDKNLTENQYYYRLEQVDFDGTIAYSDIVTLKMDGDNLGIDLNPNPARSLVNVSLAGFDANDDYELSVIGINGQIIRTITKSGNNHQLDISKLSPGVYFIQLKANESISIEKLMVH